MVVLSILSEKKNEYVKKQSDYFNVCMYHGAL
jgi:hypothetical protein